MTVYDKCPWCQTADYVMLDKNEEMFFVHCTKCGAQGPHFPDREKAERYWGVVARYAD